jgi:hypothetical protein
LPFRIDPEIFDNRRSISSSKSSNSWSSRLSSHDAELVARDHRPLQEGHLRHGLLLGVRRPLRRPPWCAPDAGGLLRRHHHGPPVPQTVSTPQASNSLLIVRLQRRPHRSHRHRLRPQSRQLRRAFAALLEQPRVRLDHHHQAPSKSRRGVRTVLTEHFSTCR